MGPCKGLLNACKGELVEPPSCNFLVEYWNLEPVGFEFSIFGLKKPLQNKAQTPSTKQGAPFGFQVDLYYIHKSRTVSFVQIRSSKGNARLDMIKSNTFSRLCDLLKWFADFRVSVQLQLFIMATPWKCCSAIFSRLQSWE